MAITRTPIIDDDGTGTTGTVIDNAWKTELYNQIDAALPVPPSSVLRLIGAASGSSTATGAVNLTSWGLPALTMADALELYFTVTISGPVPGPIQCDVFPVQSNGDPGSTPLITMSGADAGGDLVSYAVASYFVHMRPVDANQVVSVAHGGPLIGGTQARGFVWGRVAGMTTWTSPWTLYLRQMTGMPAGTPFRWAATLYRRVGTAGVLLDLGDQLDRGEPKEA